MPGLAQSVLVNASGEVLYSGLRHGFLCAHELGDRLQSTIAADELRALVAHSSGFGGQAGPLDKHHRELIDHQCASIRSSGASAAMSAAMMVNRAYRNMTQELACAALVADKAKYRQGLEGLAIDLELFCISVLRPDEFGLWAKQAGALQKLGGHERVALPVCRWDGVEQSVTANVSVNLFVLSTTGERLWLGNSGFLPHIHTRRLLGEPGSSEMGPDFMARVDAMRGNVSTLRSETERHELWLDRRHQSQSMADWSVHLARDRLSMLKNRLQRLEKDTCTLEQAGQQLKSMWQAHGDWPEQDGAWRPAASRLALIARLMGATPVLSCTGAGNLAGELDAEVKFLATVADNTAGHLPPVHRDPETWRQARAAFRPQ